MSASRPAPSSSTASPSGRRRCRAGTLARAAFRGEAEPLAVAASGRRRSCCRRRAPPRARHRRARARGRRGGVRESGCTADELPSVFASAHGDLGVTDYMCATLASAADRDLADQVPQLGAQRRGRLLDHRDRLPRGEHRAQRVRRQLRRRPARSGGAVPGRARAVLLVAYDVEAVGALRSVDRQRGLLACALVLAPSASARRSAAFDWSLVAGPATAPATARAAARRSPATRWPMPCRCSRRSRSSRSTSAPVERSRCACRATSRWMLTPASFAARAVEASAMSTTPPSRRRHHRRRPGRADARAAAQAAFAELDVLVLERRAHPVPRPRTRSASRRSRSARTISTRCSA